MTARTIVYARGGGHGHAMRGAVLQRRLRELGRDTLLLVTPESARWLGAEDRSYQCLHEVEGDELVVDTFPRGWQGELDDGTLKRFSHRTLVARYNRDTAWSADGYEQVLSPYPVALDEWDAPIARAQHTGWLVRSAPMQVDAGGDDFVVLDPARRLEPSLLARLATFARRLGQRLVHLHVAPPTVRARKILTIGAGYHTVYEHAATRADLRFFPLARRFDDQRRRVERIGRCAPTLGAVLDWLVQPMQTGAFGEELV